MTTENLSLINKINALLKQADDAAARKTDEGDTEAEAYLGKAQRLMARHSLEEEMVRQTASNGDKPKETPVEILVCLDAELPYMKYRQALLYGIADAMGLRCWLAFSGTWVKLTGFLSDIEMAKRTFEVVERQMLAAADRRIKRGDHLGIRDLRTKSGWMSAKTWKANYFTAYIEEVTFLVSRNRLEAAEEIVLAEGRQIEGGKIEGRVTGALVLVDRKKAVNLYFREQHPEKTYKNGNKKKVRHWQTPQAAVRAYNAEELGRVDGRKARLTEQVSLSA